MNVAIDYHSTITRYPVVFAHIARWAKNAGHQVFIISAAHPACRSWVENDLKYWGIPYDYLIFPNHVEGPFLDFEEAKRWKTLQFAKHHIALVFDDNPALLETVPGRLLLVREGDDSTTGNCCFATCSRARLRGTTCAPGVNGR